ncbi:MAG TPA: GTP cyclohydrolase FolE2 [Burkholderiaceae bacterium]|nr:GTP cyclohydrolase FolE2 [Burkholderiaceae bacterium]
MNAPDRIFLADVQSLTDRRNLAIQRVGVKDVVIPMAVRTAQGASLPTVAHVDMYVGLAAEIKGTHMSRFLEVLQASHAPLSLRVLQDMMARMLERLEAKEGWIEFRFPYFVSKAAPVSGVQSLMDYKAMMRIEHRNGANVVTMGVTVPVTSLCPCSKSISEYGAHNQRSHVTINAEVTGDTTLEELLRAAEQAASCEVYGLLKRSDEKYVTERAYDNPKFVEDLVRDIALVLRQHPSVVAFTVESENFESIHNHSAYALIQIDKRAV